MMERSFQCYIPSYVEIGPSVPEKKIFEGFLPNIDQDVMNKLSILLPKEVPHKILL